MKIRTLILGTIAGAGAMAALAAPASAYVACNHEGDCWHTTARETYEPTFGITVHDDAWKWHDGDRYRWREHEGRGYWRNGAWITF
jgi:hypothetical protein